MWEVAWTVALSIFLTCTLFFVVYGMAYFIVVKTIGLVRKIKEKLEKNDEEPRRD